MPVHHTPLKGEQAVIDPDRSRLSQLSIGIVGTHIASQKSVATVAEYEPLDQRKMLVENLTEMAQKLGVGGSEQALTLRQHRLRGV